MSLEKRSITIRGVLFDGIYSININNVKQIGEYIMNSILISNISKKSVSENKTNEKFHDVVVRM